LTLGCAAFTVSRTMTPAAVATSTWTVGRQTLAAFVAIATVVLVAPASTYLAATHYVEANRQLRGSNEAVSGFQRLRTAYAVATVHRQSAAQSEARTLKPRGEQALAEVQQSFDALERYPTGSGLDSQALARLRARITAELNGTSASSADETLQTLGRSVEIAARLREIRTSEAEHAAAWLYLTIGLAAALMLLALAWLLVCIRRDLLERQWFESQLQDANRLLESLFESMPAMVFAKDAKTLRFVRINRVAEKIIGYGREQLLGRNDYDFFPKDQADHFTAKDRETLAQGDIVEIQQEEIDTGDHGRRTLHTLKVPVRGKDGQPSLLLGISLDITQQKEAERRVVALNEELIRQAQLLQSSNEELESFCYSVSHDLRTPLRAINGYARLLEQEYSDRVDSQGVRYVQTICKACDRMAQLIDDLLEFSRIGRQSLSREVVDMTASARRSMTDAVEGRTDLVPLIEITELPSIVGDRTLLQLVWLNLIDNAVKYTTGVNGARVRISAERTGGEIVYSVSDNGVGFDMRYADKLFGVFQRLHSSTDYPGNGVGLAIAHRIIARHGGRIWANSEPANGSTFCFAMPSGEPMLESTTSQSLHPEAEAVH
jgi:PAS domain S-box-containing protein